jgi:hypothetical protein
MNETITPEAPPIKISRSKRWRLANRERNKAIADANNKRRRADPILYAAELAANRIYRKKNQARLRARNKLRDRVKNNARGRVRTLIWLGKMKRGSCEKCGLPNAEAHHDDYSQPPNVRWLCKKHHTEFHALKS